MDDEFASFTREGIAFGSTGPQGENIATFIAPTRGKPFVLRMDEAEILLGPEARAKLKDDFGDDAAPEAGDDFRFFVENRIEFNDARLQNAKRKGYERGFSRKSGRAGGS